MSGDVRLAVQALLDALKKHDEVLQVLEQEMKNMSEEEWLGEAASIGQRLNESLIPVSTALRLLEESGVKPGVVDRAFQRALRWHRD